MCNDFSVFSILIFVSLLSGGGGWYRLYSSMYLSPKIGPVIYLDQDVVVLASIQDLWKAADPQYMFQIKRCSGVMIFNNQKFSKDFWHSLRETKIHANAVGDQILLTKVKGHLENRKRPGPKVGPIPDRWEATQPFRNPGEQMVRRDKIASLHFNGLCDGAFFSLKNGVSRFCSEEDCMKEEQKMVDFKSSWGLADYFVYIPWQWVLYMGQSSIPFEQKGFPLVVYYHTNHTNKEQMMSITSGNL